MTLLGNATNREQLTCYTFRLNNGQFYVIKVETLCQMGFGL